MPALKALIFGISGQDGFYLKELCLREGLEVTGLSRSEGNWVRGDVADSKLVEDLIRRVKPDYVFHLAAHSTTSHEALFENHGTIATGTLNILESCYRHARKTKVFLSGSALQFENKGQPIRETDPFVATSPYVIARNYSVEAGRYFRSLGMHVYIGYFFHHDSPLRSERHINQKVVRAAQRIAEGSAEVLELGDLGVNKEFNYAGDLMEAVWLLVNQGRIDESLIGSGLAFSIEDWVASCFKFIHKNWKDFVVVKPGFKPEFETLVSNPERITSLGWSPKVGFDELVNMMMTKKS